MKLIIAVGNNMASVPGCDRGAIVELPEDALTVDLEEFLVRFCAPAVAQILAQGKTQ